MCISKSEYVAGKLNGHDLHTQAQAKTGQALFTGIAGGCDLALDTSLAEPAGLPGRPARPIAAP